MSAEELAELSAKLPELPANLPAELPAEQQPLQPLEVLYCAVCTLPPEYCEFGVSLTRCKEWLQAEHPDLFDKYYSEEALRAKIGTLSLQAQCQLEKDVAKAEAKAEARVEAARRKKLESQVTIKRIERNKRKFVTSVHGLEAFGVDLKKAAKFFGTRFATGASVTKTAQGDDEIVIQGDVSSSVMELISDADSGILCDVPGDNVVLVEEKKKKKE